MGGKGTRIGQPAPKPLLPTITRAGIVPLYQHALGQLQVVSDVVVSLVHVDTCSCIRGLGLPIIQTHELALPGALGFAGRVIAETYGDPLVALALPDSIWHLDPGRSMADVVAT